MRNLKHKRGRAEKSCININNKIIPYKAFSQGQRTLMPSEKCFLESFPQQRGGGNSREPGERHLAPLLTCLFEKLNLQLRKSQSGFLCVCVCACECARECKDALIRRGKIKAELWVSNRSNKPTFFSSFFPLSQQEERKSGLF